MPSLVFAAVILGACAGVAGAIILEPSGGWEDLRTRLDRRDG